MPGHFPRLSKRFLYRPSLKPQDSPNPSHYVVCSQKKFASEDNVLRTLDKDSTNLKKFIVGENLYFSRIISNTTLVETNDWVSNVMS